MFIEAKIKISGRRFAFNYSLLDSYQIGLKSQNFFLSSDLDHHFSHPIPANVVYGKNQKILGKIKKFFVITTSMHTLYRRAFGFAFSGKFPWSFLLPEVQ